LHLDGRITAPVVELEGRTFDEWISGRSANFRQQARRRRRRLEARGAVFRMTTLVDLDNDLEVFVRLHHQRWKRRGGSLTMNPRVERLLHEAGRALLPSERFRLWSLEVDGRTISSQLFVSAGGEVAYYNGGFDPEWAHLSPGMQTILAAIVDSCERREARVDLGGGDEEYKQRLADRDQPLVWKSVFPRTAGYPLARARILPYQLWWTGRGAIRRRVPRHVRRRVKRALGLVDS
jgi:CelD/BcsL family acetyltransferase involved in cellulose biosynthesis